MILAHDQVWSADDWITIALFPPLLFGLLLLVRTLLVRISPVSFRPGDLAEDMKFFASVILVGWIIICALVALALGTPALWKVLA